MDSGKRKCPSLLLGSGFRLPLRVCLPSLAPCPGARAPDLALGVEPDSCWHKAGVQTTLSSWSAHPLTGFSRPPVCLAPDPVRLPLWAGFSPGLSFHCEHRTQHGACRPGLHTVGLQEMFEEMHLLGMIAVAAKVTRESRGQMPTARGPAGTPERGAHLAGQRNPKSSSGSR